MKWHLDNRGKIIHRYFDKDTSYVCFEGMPEHLIDRNLKRIHEKLDAPDPTTPLINGAHCRNHTSKQVNSKGQGIVTLTLDVEDGSLKPYAILLNVAHMMLLRADLELKPGWIVEQICGNPKCGELDHLLLRNLRKGGSQDVAQNRKPKPENREDDDCALGFLDVPVIEKEKEILF